MPLNRLRTQTGRVSLPAVLIPAFLLTSSPVLAVEKVGVYSHVEVVYERLSYDRPNSTGAANGGAVGGSYELLPYSYVFGDYRQLRDAGSRNSLDLKDGRIGAGGFWPVTSSVDIFAEGSLLRTETEHCIEGNCVEDTANGYGLGIGAWFAINPAGAIRVSWTQREFNSSAANGDDARLSDRVIEFGLHSRYTGHGLVLGGQSYENGSSLRIGYRYTF